MSRPPPGLRNLGNTCYLNAALQALLAALPPRTGPAPTRPGGGDGGDGGEDVVAGAFDRLHHAYGVVRHTPWSAADPRPLPAVCLTPEGLVGALARSASSAALRQRGRQQDAHEAIIELVGRCAALGAATKFGFDSVLGLGAGEPPSVTKWDGHHLTLPALDSVQRMVTGHARPEATDGGATKRTLIRTAPGVLVVHVQRWDPKTGRRVQARVVVEHEIWLPVFPASAGPAEAATRAAYDLVGVVHHHGSTADSGHYMADVRLDGAWYRCNDSHVLALPAPPLTRASTTAYVAVYRGRG